MVWLLLSSIRKHWSIFIKSTYSRLRSIWIETYCPFKDSTYMYISIKSSFFATWNIFNQGQYGLIHNVHLVNFDQSLPNSHIVWSMLTFAMFVAILMWSKCLNHVSKWTILPFQVFYISFNQKLFFATSNIFEKI